MTIKITIVYHSGYGHTAKVAEAIGEGASENNAQVRMVQVDKMTQEDQDIIDNSHAIIFGSPTYMGSVSGPFKMFMDTTSKQWATQKWKNKIAAGFTNSGAYSGDKLASLQQMFHLAMQHGMIWVGQTESAPSFSQGELPQMDAVNRLGSWSGLMTQSNHKEGPDTAPHAGDLKTAKLFGKRIAEVTAALKVV